MAGPNINKRLAREASSGISFGGPEDVRVQGLGSVGTTADGSVYTRTGPELVQQSNILQSLGERTAGAAGASVGGVSEFGQSALEQAKAGFAAAGEFDPLDAAEQRFSRLQSVLAPRREAARANLDAELFRQGRLDSTGGSRQAEALESGIASEDALLLDRMVTEGETARRAELQSAGNLGSVGVDVGTTLNQQALKNFEQQRQTPANILTLLNQGTNIGAAATEAQVARAGAINSGNQVLASRGGGSTGSTIGGIAGGILGSAVPVIGTTTGAMAGAGIGSIFD